MVFNSYVSLPEGTSRTNHQNSVYFSIRWSISLVTTRSITTCFDKNGAVQPWNPLLFTFKIASKKTQILVCMIVHHCKIVHNISILMLVVCCCHIHNYVYIHMYFNHFQPTPVQPALQNLGTFWAPSFQARFICIAIHITLVICPVVNWFYHFIRQYMMYSTNVF